MNSEHPLRKAIQQLPERSAKPDTWQQLERQLVSEEAFQQSINQLPNYEPRANVWNTIGTSLSNEPKVRKLWWLYATAAAVSVLIVAGLLLNENRGEEVTTTYSEEWVAGGETVLKEPHDLGMEGEVLEQEAWEFIRQHCQSQPVCQTKEFQTLIAHWEELDSEETELRKTLDQLGHDPSLIKYQVRIQNMKANATKELIQLVL
ncbi:hypothetical protein [Tunicatimonas pelagia]|uniref:hypothetical protein n=1 Tax=Tunicatimonas pelagia TaxID=931531 RepID=UPI0026660936|nr:hypothetical protein [Tunicatimonas pelagia]WKN46308.1 hypothetical protein P0M28_15270 [Tunicatimonas pelagia]